MQDENFNGPDEATLNESVKREAGRIIRDE